MIKNNIIKIDVKILSFVIVINFVTYFFVELINDYFAGDYSFLIRVNFGFVIAIIISAVVWLSDKKIRKRFSLGPEYGMIRKSALDGITFLWWLPIALLPSGLLTGLAIKYSGFEFGRTSFGPLLILYISFVALELRNYYIATKKFGSRDQGTM